jgi:hemolysin III
MTDSSAFERTLPQRPLLRGMFHLPAAVAAIAGTVLLVLLADSARAYVGAAIFGASLILVYTTSTAYHRIPWSPRLRGIARRLDHAMIFTLIAGTYTPFCLLVLNTAWWISMLSVVWGIAAAGIILKLIWPGAPKWLSVLMYATIGWLALVTAPQLVSWFTAGPLALLLLGGLLYTLGGVVYAVGKPSPYPRVFGYHEVFHVLVIAGSVLHFSLVAIYVLPG